MLNHYITDMVNIHTCIVIVQVIIMLACILPKIMGEKNKVIIEILMVLE